MFREITQWVRIGQDDQNQVWKLYKWYKVSNKRFTPYSIEEAMGIKIQKFYYERLEKGTYMQKKIQ